MTATWIRWHVRAPRATVYRLLLDAESVRQWVGPDGKTGRVHEFDPTEGGVFRITLIDDESDDTGKTTANGDTYHGRFTRLIPDEQVVGIIEFETDDPTAIGKQTITYVLGDAGGGTDIVAMHEGLPDAITPEDNELGWRISLGKLAARAEAAR
ncbi:SRPBCC domain-containing protein [Nocardia niwae]|uniref:SRPBCC domain-containing protein n=1 Tax=Nocardia niwae TaxID=626084 RepID=UPI0007A49EEA|nr:SRPBCC domain-containing protein [Nocardia niwae]